ncbi:hypothetical protein COO60DRAFT_1528798 [Scenedesmus sp. NREL 46B-D3]|nr:hypothetical protein COO60DRAFT_1528798 [Scenedesmus sp. NREL 46B-D3]
MSAASPAYDAFTAIQPLMPGVRVVAHAFQGVLAFHPALFAIAASRYFDVNEAEEKLTATLKWRHMFKADDITLDDVQAEYATGKSVVHDRLDNFGRPVLIIRANKHNPSEHLMHQQLPQGREQILGLIDLRAMSLSNIDLAFVAFMVDAFFVTTPGVLLVDAPWIFKAPWELIKPLLRKYAALVRFVSRRELAAEYFTADTLPAGFRG